MVNILYDEVLFLINDEYYKITGEHVDVQSVQSFVEEPELYAIGRFRANDEQLSYLCTRQDCLKSFKEKCCFRKWYYYYRCHALLIMETVQFECGNQKGGNLFCCTYGTSAKMMDDFTHCCNVPLITYRYVCVCVYACVCVCVCVCVSNIWIQKMQLLTKNCPADFHFDKSTF